MNETNDRRESDRVLRELEELVRAFRAAGRALLPGSDDELLQSIVDAARQLFGAAAASIALVDQDASCLVFRVSSGAGQDQVVGMRIPLDQGIAGYVAMTGEPLAVSNVRRDPRFAESAAASTGYVPQSILAMPLLYEDRVIGVIEVLDKIAAPSFGMQDMQLLGLFAHQAAIAIHQSRQFDLLGLGFVHALERVVKLEANEDLHAALTSLLSGHDPKDDSERDLIALADLFYQIGQLGPAEREAAKQVLKVIGDLAQRTKRAGHWDGINEVSP